MVSLIALQNTTLKVVFILGSKAFMRQLSSSIKAKERCIKDKYGCCKLCIVGKMLKCFKKSISYLESDPKWMKVIQEESNIHINDVVLNKKKKSCFTVDWAEYAT